MHFRFGMSIQVCLINKVASTRYTKMLSLSRQVYISLLILKLLSSALYVEVTIDELYI